MLTVSTVLHILNENCRLAAGLMLRRRSADCIYLPIQIDSEISYTLLVGRRQRLHQRKEMPRLASAEIRIPRIQRVSLKNA